MAGVDRQTGGCDDGDGLHIRQRGEGDGSGAPSEFDTFVMVSEKVAPPEEEVATSMYHFSGAVVESTGTSRYASVAAVVYAVVPSMLQLHQELLEQAGGVEETLTCTFPPSADTRMRYVPYAVAVEPAAVFSSASYGVSAGRHE